MRTLLLAMLVGNLHASQSGVRVYQQDRGAVTGRAISEDGFGDRVNVAAADWGELVAVADLNLDGQPDLIWSDSIGRLAVLYSGASAIAVLNLPPLTEWTVLGLADLNHDGHPDLLLRGTGSQRGRAAVWYLTGANGAAFLASADVGTLPGWSAVAAGDLDGDGNTDLIWKNEATAEGLIWFLNPAGLPARSEALPGAEAGSSLAGVLDVNRDGRADLLWVGGSGDRATVWLMNGAARLRSVSFSGVGSRPLVVASISTGAAVATLAPAPLSRWKGINYSPRYHGYFRMLQDWTQFDARLGRHVYEAVDDDLAALSESGFNVLHLYLWDRRLLWDAVQDRWCPADPVTGKRDAACVAPYAEPAGFPDYPEDPDSGAGAEQFAALQDFVARAELHGLYVALHFASGTLIDQVTRIADGFDQAPPRAATCETVAGPFANWAGRFISALTPVHRNVLLWGVAYAFGADGSGNTELADSGSVYNRCFGRVYRAVDLLARQNAPPGTAGVLGLIGVNPAFNFQAPKGAAAYAQFVRPESGYAWDIATTQRVVRDMTDELTALYGRPKSPDVYMVSLYNPHAGDLTRNLLALMRSNDGDLRRALVPAEKLFPVEFAISSAGTGADSWGDNQTPTTTVDGQNAWLENTLCAFREAGISKSAYWGMYDAASLWSGAPWFQSGQQLAWNGYWGLGFESASDGRKPAWKTIETYNARPDSLVCPVAPSPNVNAWLLSDYVTVGQAAKVVWTATDTTRLTLNGEANLPSWACDGSAHAPSAEAFSAALGGTCAFTMTAASDTPGQRAFTMTAYNGGQQTSVNLKLTIGLAPLIVRVMDGDPHGQTIALGLNQIFSVSGKGFGLGNTNSLRWSRPGYADIWMREGDRKGHYFAQDTFQISTALDDRVAPGTWSVYAYNGVSPRAAFVATVEVR